ncbi:MAG: hypothetical protein QG635_2147, partial [Bacteroidota bacterium]|nr:hypothetical protein [Bacteroidota bacterium]
QNVKFDEHEIKQKFELIESTSFNIYKSRNIINELKDKDRYYQICQYRPFDYRYLFYHESIIDRPRKEIMLNIQENNFALISGRAGHVVGGKNWNLVFVTNIISDLNLFYRGGSVLFPAYILKNGEENIFFGVKEPAPEYNAGRTASGLFKSENFTPEFREFIDGKYNTHKPFSPEEIIGYIYAILHCPSYREKYSEALMLDFPAVPFCDSAELFEKLSSLGLDLIQKHLLKSIPSGEDFRILGENKGNGDNIILKPSYNPSSKALFYNKTQYFADIPEEVYEFNIGGYQVLNKYLKDRKGRLLSLDEITNIENVVKVLVYTIEQMKKIDILAEEWI